MPAFEPKPRTGHGTSGRYANGCRCDACRVENNRRSRISQAAYRARLKEA